MSNIKIVSSSIDVFFTKSIKAKNGEINSIRELIIDIIQNETYKPSPFLSQFIKDKDYGRKWHIIIKATNNIFNTIHDMIPIDKIKDYTSQKLERGNNNLLDITSTNKKSILSNVDFALVYYKDNTVIHSEPIEFKFNANKITDVPQLLQDNDNKIYCPPDIPTFTKYIYDNLFTDEYLSKLELEKPSLDEYIEILSISCPKKEWHKTNIYPEFFKKLRSKVSNKKEFMDKEEQLRINYINLYGSKRFSLDYIKSIFDKQMKKTFILFQNNEFVIYRLKGNIANLTLCNNNKSPLALKFTDNIYCYEYRLCWKNRNGILNPAWKFSIKNI